MWEPNDEARIPDLKGCYLGDKLNSVFYNRLWLVINPWNFTSRNASFCEYGVHRNHWKDQLSKYIWWDIQQFFSAFCSLNNLSSICPLTNVSNYSRLVHGKGEFNYGTFGFLNIWDAWRTIKGMEFIYYRSPKFLK